MRTSLLMCLPQPHAQPPAAESVTAESAEAVKALARCTPSCRHSDTQFEERSKRERQAMSASVSVPVLMPSETMKMTFRAVGAKRRSAVRADDARATRGAARPAASAAPAPKNERRSIPGAMGTMWE